jgi:hypothetical protein
MGFERQLAAKSRVGQARVKRKDRRPRAAAAVAFWEVMSASDTGAASRCKEFCDARTR